jgi:RNA polymerase sigma factor (sigma-70 family)
MPQTLDAAAASATDVTSMTDATSADDVPTLVEHLFRRQAAQLVATLTRILGPARLELAEDAVQETLLKALRSWPYQGLPANPAGWLLTVARNTALDHLRRERNWRDKQAAIAALQRPSPYDDPQQASERLDDSLRDDQLRLMFVCCHPALSRDTRVALTLKTLGGFGVPEIARAFLTPETTIAQRLTRARRTLRTRNLPFVVPEAHELPARLDSVLDVIYLLFNEGYSASHGAELTRAELCTEAIRLLTLLAEQPVGDTPRVHALLALLLLQASRLPARTDADGNLLLLEEQDRARWDRELLLAGLRRLARSATGDELSAYHLEAGIAACHAVAPSYAATDWPRILEHYDDLLRLQPTPVAALNRAVALAMVRGPAAGAAELERIRGLPGLDSYYLLHVTAAEFARRLGHTEAALEHLRRAMAFDVTEPERRCLARRLAEVTGEGTGNREQCVPR